MFHNIFISDFYILFYDAHRDSVRSYATSDLQQWHYHCLQREVSNILLPGGSHGLCVCAGPACWLWDHLRHQGGNHDLCVCAGPACWLWDYLRRSGASGYMLPLSGGADSSATAAIVGCMTQLVTKAVDAGDKLVEADARRLVRP